MTGILPTYAELEVAIEGDGAPEFIEFAQLLVNACIKWPTFNLKEPSDLVREVARELRGQLTQSNIEKFSQYLPVSRSENWPHKMQACVAMLELFQYGRTNPEPTLDQLILDQWSNHQSGRAIS